jgi:hypothetical protein
MGHFNPETFIDDKACVFTGRYKLPDHKPKCKDEVKPWIKPDGWFKVSCDLMLAPISSVSKCVTMLLTSKHDSMMDKPFHLGDTKIANTLGINNKSVQRAKNEIRQEHGFNIINGGFEDGMWLETRYDLPVKKIKEKPYIIIDRDILESFHDGMRNGIIDYKDTACYYTICCYRYLELIRLRKINRAFTPVFKIRKDELRYLTTMNNAPKRIVELPGKLTLGGGKRLYEVKDNCQELIFTSWGESECPYGQKRQVVSCPTSKKCP